MHDLKNIALQIFQETLAAIDIRASLVDKLARAGSCIQVDDRTIDLAGYREIIGIAIGKAAFPMAEGLADLLAPDFQVTGILVAPAAPSTSLPGWETIIAGHPVPTAESFRAGRAILERLSRCDEGTLVFFLLSGGGSALVEQPLEGDISLEDFQQLHRALVTCGAPIEQINAVRKHLSATKGGRLAAAAPHATKITLGVSDVPQGFESALASGPTLPDPTTVQDALRVVDEFSLLPKLPPKIREMFVTRSLRESPKEGDPVFDRAHFLLLLGMRDLFHHGHQAAGSHGFLAICDDCTDGWPIDKAADYLLSQLAELQLTNLGKRVAVISDGEVSSPVTGNGVGGRNSAFVLACVEKIAGRHVAVLSAGTDGIDGNSFAAGAVADGKTLLRARDARMDPADFLHRSDSYTFFEQLSDAVITGPTGNNLRDFRILLAH